MTPLSLLKSLTKKFSQENEQWALAGGLAASVYRDRPRLTNDIDIAFLPYDRERAVERAEALLAGLGLKTSLGWISAPNNELSKPVALVIGQASDDASQPSVDLLLPVFPWLEPSVLRAQANLLDFGFGPIPTLTPEDVIIAKCFALQLSPERLLDEDDIRSILAAKLELQTDYLQTTLKQLGIQTPRCLVFEQ